MRIQGEEIDVKAAIRSLDVYSGHADATELVEWVDARMPVRRGIFLTHSEPDAMAALKLRLSSRIADERIIMPVLDEAFSLDPEAGKHLETGQPARLAPEKIARLDWNNDLSKLLLDINEVVGGQADERGRQEMIRRLRPALPE